MVNTTYRKFLNKSRDLTAFVAFQVGDEWAHFKIMDCGRVVTLDFQMDNRKEIEASRSKVKELRLAVDKFEAELERRITKAQAA